MGIGGVVLQFKAEADKARRDVEKLTRSLNNVRGGASGAAGGLSKLAKVGIGAAAGVAGGLAVGAAAAVNFAESAIADAASAEKLAGALKKAAHATKDQVSAVEDWITAQGIAKGVVDDQLRPALARLVRSTGSVSKAQKLAKIGMDIAAETGKDYSTVAAALAKANDGNVNALKRLGLTLGEQAQNAIDYKTQLGRLVTLQSSAAAAYRDSGSGSKEYAAAAEKVAKQQKVVNALLDAGVDWQDELGQAYKGAAKKAAGTIEGTWARVKLIFGEIGESLGQFAIPMLKDFADWFADKGNQKSVQDWIEKVGEWSTEVGENFTGKIKDFIDYLQSPEGQTAIAEFSANLKSIADVFAGIADAIGKVNSAVSKVSFARQKALGFLGMDSDESEAKARKAKADALRAEKDRIASMDPAQLSGTRRTSTTGGAYAGSGGVTINIHNPKAEKTSTSVAAAIRVAKRAGY